jgi:transposase
VERSDQRLAAVAALAALAGSSDYRDRADVGRALASFAGLPAARGPLERLLLDAEDTFVTRATAEALLRRGDAAGLALVAETLRSADDDQQQWIATAVSDVFGVFARERDRALQRCAGLPGDHTALSELLAELTPTWLPAEPRPVRRTSR